MQDWLHFGNIIFTKKQFTLSVSNSNFLKGGGRFGEFWMLSRMTFIKSSVVQVKSTWRNGMNRRLRCSKDRMRRMESVTLDSSLSFLDILKRLPISLVSFCTLQLRSSWWFWCYVTLTKNKWERGSSGRRSIEHIKTICFLSFQSFIFINAFNDVDEVIKKYETRLLEDKRLLST